jgi:DNA-directed RNA polymerase subunit M/transcription elongation factor TFIIS
MKFCEQCRHHLIPDTSRNELTFVCGNCSAIYKSSPEDTLRSEINYRTSDLDLKYEVFQEIAPTDPVSNKVGIECPQCFSPYLTQIFVGENCVCKYVCDCGFKTNAADLNNAQ